MSTTYSTAKRATLFVDSAGKEWWQLEEQTYDSNVFPQTRKWFSYGMANLEQARKEIIISASSCEGGTLQGTTGPILSESYIKQWKDAMCLPQRCDDIDIEVTVSTWTYQATTIEERNAAFADFSNKVGLPIHWGKIKVKATSCTSEQLQIIANARWSTNMLTFKFSNNGVHQGDSWLGEMGNRNHEKSISHAIGIQVNSSKYFALEVDGKLYFEQDWMVRSNIFHDFADQQLTLTEAIHFCKKVRSEMNEATFLQEIDLVRPEKKWGFDHILTLEQIFGNATKKRVPISELAKIHQLLYFVVPMIDLNQFQFKVEKQESLLV